MVTASFWPDTKVQTSTVGLDCQEGHYDVDPPTHRHGHF